MSITASEMGKRSAKARMKKLSAKQRSDIARNAARARWKKTTKRRQRPIDTEYPHIKGD